MRYTPEKLAHIAVTIGRGELACETVRSDQGCIVAVFKTAGDQVVLGERRFTLTHAEITAARDAVESLAADNLNCAWPDMKRDARLSTASLRLQETAEAMEWAVFPKEFDDRILRLPDGTRVAVFFLEQSTSGHRLHFNLTESNVAFYQKEAWLRGVKVAALEDARACFHEPETPARQKPPKPPRRVPR